ncbi:MAG: SDR family NAD(P)-dependent oxidoreductase, partial [Solimonas sp.]
MAKTKAVVLGVGAERGLGAAVSRRFAKEGYHVLVAGRTAAKVEKVAAAIRAAGGAATALAVDGTR